MSFCPFLSRLTSLPGSRLFPFPCSSPRAACSMCLVIIRWGLCCAPHRHFSLSALHCHLLTPCTLFSALCAPPSLCCPPLSRLALANTSLCSMSPLSPHPAPSQVSAAVAAEVQDARRRPPAGLPLQASLPCGPLSPPWLSHQAMVPSLASRGPRSTRRYAFRWLLTYLGEGEAGIEGSWGQKR